MARGCGTASLRLTRANGVVFDLGQALDTAQVFLESKDLHLGDPHVRKMLRKYRHEVNMTHLTTNMQLIIKHRDNLDDELVAENPISLTNRDETVMMRTPSRRYFRIRLEDIGVKERWLITAIDLFGRATGRRID